MNKSAYESYEFLEDEDQQFLVVQDNGTFLINRPIQYLSEVQDVNTVLEEVEQCAVYDENSKHFYVNTNSTAELIPDQFVVPSSSNNFYIESVESLKDEHIEDNVIEHNHILAESTNDMTDTRLTNSCTEVTISDEQYQLLQDKGWILLETNGRILLLDTVGLQDITDNPKLIEKLKNEIDDCSIEEQVTSTFNNSGHDSYDNIIISTTNQNVLENNLMDVDAAAQGSSSSSNDVTAVSTDFTRPKSENNVNEPVQDVAASLPNNMPIKVKTKHLFKDIPREIVLGRTVNGKKLVARVVKTDKPLGDLGGPSVNGLRATQTDPATSQTSDTGLSEVKFENVLRQTLNGTALRCSNGDIIAAENVVQQLLRVPAFKPAVIDRVLIITKILLLETEQGTTYNESIPTLVSGRVTLGDSGASFTYIPDLLQQLLRDEEANIANRTKEISEGSFLHIHIREMKGVDGIVRVSITLNKRHLPLTIIREMSIRQSSTVFACSACAEVFDSLQGLKIHQQAGCIEVQNNDLIISTESTDNMYTVNKTDTEKSYICNQCHSRFTKLANCQKHIKTHFRQNKESESNNSEHNAYQSRLQKVYKCKMCPSTYFYAATLSKHIVSKHIKVRTK